MAFVFHDLLAMTIGAVDRFGSIFIVGIEHSLPEIRPCLVLVASGASDCSHCEIYLYCEEVRSEERVRELMKARVESGTREDERATRLM